MDVPFACNAYAADEVITHDDDDARAEALGEVFAGVKNALVLK